MVDFYGINVGKCTIPYMNAMVPDDIGGDGSNLKQHDLGSFEL